MSDTSIPRILLVEDDPVSRAFLAAAAAGLPARVEQAASIAEARVLALGGKHDLFLIDANLPDGRGIDLLRELRGHTNTTALAHTAATHRAELDALVDAGFEEVLVKPLSAAQLQHAIVRALRGSPAPAMPMPAGCDKLPVWDDDAALAAVNGLRPQAMQLRALFMAELPAQRDSVVSAAAVDDIATLQALLHRLQGSCGFVGAARLSAAIRALRDAPDAAGALEAFANAASDTLAANDSA
jgi:CheY-like chemotaxis protein/HPt (histidine-containing phosphotransfer) domain-containing protein